MQYLVKLITILLILLAVTPLKGVAAISTDAKLQYNKGVDYYKLGQLEESVSCFKKAVELDPNYIDAYYNLGTILEFLQQDDEALTVFKQIILRKPEDYESVYKAAEISKRLGEDDKARMYLTLIPQDSMFANKANKLAQSLSSEKSLPKNQLQNGYQENRVVEESSYVKVSSKVYEDISSPTGIVTDKEGNIFVAGYSDNTIYKIGANNEKIVFIKDKKIDGPIGLAIDNAENIYIANYNKDNVLKIDKTGRISIFVPKIEKPYCMYISSGALFVSAQGSNSVMRFGL